MIRRFMPLAVLVASCVQSVQEETPRTLPPTPTITTQVAADAGPVAAPARFSAAPKPIYFVMTDRFFNGDTSNDDGGSGSDDPLVSGFLPTDKGFYHGGDLAGLAQKVDYLAGLGVEAIWLTPPLRNRPVQGNGTIEGSSAAYHGYWITDFETIDPHLGTEEDMHELIDLAHERGISVYFDIVANHTADVITFAEDSFAYLGETSTPYLDEAGDPIDITLPSFPEVSTFPYTPVFGTAEDSVAKNPSWLNDPERYHNRGNSTFDGPSSLLGDFFGLDDLFTEQIEVRQGMVGIYTELMDRFEIDGFRVDTAKHVEDGFWRYFLPRVQQHADKIGRPEFVIYAEVFDFSPIAVARYITQVGFPSALDFPFSQAVETFVTTGDAGVLEALFDRDDWYTDPDSSAHDLVTFVGNHDMGRIGRRLNGTDDGKVAKMRMVFELLFLARGTPVIYYGDEQGFVGDGGDKDARQTMFPSLVDGYLNDDLIGTDATHASARFDVEHPFYQAVSTLAALRQTHPALVGGAQITRLAEGGTFAISRIDRAERIEHVVVFNGPVTASITIPTSSPHTLFGSVYGPAFGLDSDDDGFISIDLEPWSTVVLVADGPLPQPTQPLVFKAAAEPSGEWVKMTAEVGDRRYAEVTFALVLDGNTPFVIGVDDAPPYRLYWKPDPELAGAELIATAVDGFGNVASVVARLPEPN